MVPRSFQRELTYFSLERATSFFLVRRRAKIKIKPVGNLYPALDSSTYFVGLETTASALAPSVRQGNPSYSWVFGVGIFHQLTSPEEWMQDSRTLAYGAKPERTSTPSSALIPSRVFYSGYKVIFAYAGPLWDFHIIFHLTFTSLRRMVGSDDF